MVVSLYILQYIMYERKYIVDDKFKRHKKFIFSCHSLISHSFLWFMIEFPNDSEKQRIFSTIFAIVHYFKISR